MKVLLACLFTAAVLGCACGCSPSTDTDPRKYFTGEEIERGKSYNRTGYTVFFLRVFLTVLFFLVFIYSGAGKRLGELLCTRAFTLQVIIFFAAFFLIYAAVHFPLSYYRSYIVEHQFGFSNQTTATWFTDYFKSLGVSLVIGGILVTGLYWLLKIFPGSWWIFAACAFGIYLGVIIVLKPVIIDPMFNKFGPLENAGLKEEIIRLAEKAGVKVGDVLVMDASRRTSHTNAYFTGFGHTRRIVLYDTLIEKHTEKEVLSVVAHEIGHWKHAHIYKGFFMAVAGTVLALLLVKVLGGWLVPRMPLGAKSLASPGSMVLIFFIIYVLSVITMPLENAVSRYFERQADNETLELTGDGETFVNLQVRLSKANASDPTPHPFIYFWLYSHPSAMERIEVGEKFGS